MPCYLLTCMDHLNSRTLYCVETFDRIHSKIMNKLLVSHLMLSLTNCVLVVIIQAALIDFGAFGSIEALPAVNNV
jgi:hypothetical protein